jgi:hypothetical protein
MQRALIDKKYIDWIRINVDKDCMGKCKEYSKAMQKDFPELKLVRGHYYCPIWGERGHWWLKTGEGDIIDPTKSQFPSSGVGEYIEWDEGREEPTGLCPNCGGYVYGGRSCCSDQCHTEFVASLNTVGDLF